MYDFYLGGKDNYEVDRGAAKRVMEHLPSVRKLARSNRDFLHRAVREVVGSGVRQIIDVGTGIPTSPNTHEVAREADPHARVVYADNDPIVATYAGAKLTNLGNAGFVLADVRDPKAIIEHPTTRSLIDFDQPVAVMLVAVLHFISDAEDPKGIVETLTERLPTGSYLVLSHVSGDFDAGGDGDIQRAARVYDDATARFSLRGRDEVRALFEGFDLLEPGLVQPPEWRPGQPLAADEDRSQYPAYVGVGVKKG
ncbi:SAM-dependent methyltransferase [Streptomyces sp. AJS327]|nr:SAM-dependent methyltransferase [Streptomyces sp. AJS327]